MASPAGTDSITIHADGGVPYTGYLLVFSGLSPGFDLGIGETEQWADGSAGDATAPTLPAARGNVLLSAVVTCGTAHPVLSSAAQPTAAAATLRSGPCCGRA